jgi:hypothetical protein
MASFKSTNVPTKSITKSQKKSPFGSHLSLDLQNGEFKLIKGQIDTNSSIIDAHTFLSQHKEFTLIHSYIAVTVGDSHYMSDDYYYNITALIRHRDSKKYEYVSLNLLRDIYYEDGRITNEYNHDTKLTDLPDSAFVGYKKVFYDGSKYPKLAEVLKDPKIKTMYEYNGDDMVSIHDELSSMVNS